MNINEVLLLYRDGTADLGDFVSSFVMGSICLPDPEHPDQCIPGSEVKAVDNNLDTFPRFGHTSNMNLNERFRLTVGFNGISPTPGQSSVQFSNPNYNGAEGTPKATVTVNRTGDTSGATDVKVSTTEPSGNQAVGSGSASERKDYTISLQTLQ
jgi:hypothetical protein